MDLKVKFFSVDIFSKLNTQCDLRQLVIPPWILFEVHFDPLSPQTLSTPFIDVQTCMEKEERKKALSPNSTLHLSHSSRVFLLTECFLFVCCRLMAGAGGSYQMSRNMDVKFLAMLDPNCRLNFPKSEKLVALLFLPDTLQLSFFILLSLLFIITNCGLQSHAGLEGLQLFINCGSLASGPIVVCVNAPRRSQKPPNIFQDTVTHCTSILFWNSGLLATTVKHEPLKKVFCILSHSFLLK